MHATTHNIHVCFVQSFHKGYVNQYHKFRAVVGYLGTIEMPVAGDTGAVDESAMRSCIRRLRLEKRVHTRDGTKIVCLGT